MGEVKKIQILTSSTYILLSDSLGLDGVKLLGDSDLRWSRYQF